MRTLFLYILIIAADFVLGQNSCDDNSLIDLQKQFNKADKKGITDEYKFASIAFDIAECYRQHNDTTALKWYRDNLRVSKSAIKGCDRSEDARNIIFRMGLSSLYLAKYKDAENYFQKAIAANYDDATSYYYLGLTLMRLNMWHEALAEFINFSLKSEDQKDVETLKQTCSDKINGK